MFMEELQVGSSDFDVFINFRGVDTRNIFVGHLYSALKRRGICAFMDSKDLRKGEDIGRLLNVIRGCKLSIAVFSHRYAESKWCLEELSQMLECHETKGHIILPIFFKVDPSDVRNQNECFEILPLTHTKEPPETLSRWKNALQAAGDKSGWVVRDRDDQSEIVDQVVKEAWIQLSTVSLIDVKHSVGLKSRVQDILVLLSAGNPKDVQFLGIYGQGGIGKTTIAVAVYNCISKYFSKKCFLENVREEALKPNGLLSLQNKLIYNITGAEGKACSLKEGSQEIKKIFQRQKTLLILDDVDHKRQLDALARDLDWFGSESTIIITTRERRVLNGVHEKNKKIYEHGELNQEESLKLFSLHAFSTDKPPDNFMQLSVDVVRTTGGLPLALEVLGLDVSEKKGQTDRQFWDSMLQMLRRTLHDAVFENLKISFDSLHHIEKGMFLDVACLFIGWQEETVISIWQACDIDARYRLEALKGKSLLKTDGSATKVFWMHNQIQEMGRRIAYNQEFGNPYEHTRLWSYKKTMKVLKSGKGNKMVEGLHLDFDTDNRINLHTKNFEIMPKLRLLNIDGVTLEGSFQHLPSKLRWLQWHRCPLKQLPVNSFHDDLVMLDLSYGSFGQAWKNWRENEWFQQLKVLRLSYCMSLSQSPDFSGFPCLERLYLDHCICLVTLHKSIGELQQLVYLDLECCLSLKELPNNICSMRCLENLILKECKSLKFLPGSIDKLKRSLVKLSLDGINMDFCVKMEQFRGLVNTSNNELRELISRMGRYSNVVTNKRSWQRQDQQGRSLKRQIWKPLQMTDDGSLKRYLIPDDIDEIGAWRLVAHVSLNFHSTEDEDITWILLSKKDISLTFDSNVHMKAGNKTSYKIRLVIEGSNKFIGPSQVEYIHEFEGFDWFGVQLEGVDAIEISDVSVNFMLWLEVLGVNLFLVKESPMFDSHQFNNNAEICQSYGDQTCFEIVRYPPIEDEVNKLLRRKNRGGLMKWMMMIMMIMTMMMMKIFILMKRRSGVADYLITETIRCMTLSPNRFCFSS